MSEERIEYAQEYPSSMLVRSDDPELERVYPRVLWTMHVRKNGGRVWKRKVIVVEEWTEVTSDE